MRELMLAGLQVLGILSLVLTLAVIQSPQLALRLSRYLWARGKSLASYRQCKAAAKQTEVDCYRYWMHALPDNSPYQRRHSVSEISEVEIQS